MTRMRKVVCFVIACLLTLSLTGCKDKKDDKKDKKEPFQITVNGNQYDLSKGIDKVVGQMSDNGIYALDVRNLSAYGHKGMYTNEAAEEYYKNIQDGKASQIYVDLVSGIYTENPEEVDRLRDGAVRYSISLDKIESCSILDGITVKTEVNACFGLKEEESLDNYLSDDEHFEQSYDALTKACKLDGFQLYVLSQQVYKYQLGAVFYDDSCVDLDDYAVKNIEDFLKTDSIRKECAFSRVYSELVEYAHSNLQTDDTSSEVYYKAFQAMSKRLQAGVKTQLAINNAIDCGLKKVEEGKINHVYVETLRDGAVDIVVYSQDGKICVFDNETDADYMALWK